MTLRLLLVGAVTALGLDLPSRCDINEWTRSSCGWLNARLAEREDRMPEDVRAFADTIAPTTIDVPIVEATSAPIATPIVPAVPSKPAVETVAAASPSPKIADKPCVCHQVDSILADLEFDVLMDEWICGIKVETGSSSLAAKAASTALDEDAAFNAVMEETIAGFTADLNPVASTTELVADEWDLVQVERDLLGLTAIDSDRPESLGSDSDALVVAAPLPVEDVALAETVPAVRGQRLSTAVRLTGQAARAWLTVLQGQAVVSLRP